MASAIPDFLTRITLYTTPQHAFEYADALLLQAAQLRQHATHSQSRSDVLNERADILTTTAFGLQIIANQDRESIQSLFDRALHVHQDLIEAYRAISRKAAHLNAIQERVEDGMATVEELEAFLDDVHESCANDRLQRSLAPEPESPPSPSNSRPAVESVQSEMVVKHTPVYPLKRKLSEIREVSDMADGPAKALKGIKRGPADTEGRSERDPASAKDEDPLQTRHFREIPASPGEAQDSFSRSTLSRNALGVAIVTSGSSSAPDYISLDDRASKSPECTAATSSHSSAPTSNSNDRQSTPNENLKKRMEGGKGKRGKQDKVKSSDPANAQTAKKSKKKKAQGHENN